MLRVQVVGDGVRDVAEDVELLGSEQVDEEMPNPGQVERRRRFDDGQALVGEQYVESAGVGVAPSAANAA